MSNSKAMQELRQAIETADRNLLLALRDRMNLVERIVESKLTSAYPFRDRLREERVLERVRHLAVELGLDAHEVERFYRQIMEMSIAHQQQHVERLDNAPLRVAYQGVEGSYTHLTAQRRYAGRGGGALLTGCRTFREAVDAVRDGSADVGLLPIENTTAGSINETYDLLAEGGVAVNAEVVSRIEHCLLVLPGTPLEDLRTVISHPQAIAQCEAFWRSTPWITPQADFDTAGAALRVKESGDRTLGAIAGASAAQLFGLEVLRRGIQSQEGNYTRFVEIAREPVPCPPGALCKTSILIQLVGDHPGALGDVLTAFSRRSVNLTKLESRPVAGQAWTYRFYLDLEGHAASAPIQSALAEIESRVTHVRVLGTYPRAEDAGSAPPGVPPASPSS
jgi:chorismate mutase/prephenate dehydratase